MATRECKIFEHRSPRAAFLLVYNDCFIESGHLNARAEGGVNAALVLDIKRSPQSTAYPIENQPLTLFYLNKCPFKYHLPVSRLCEDA